MKPSLVTEFLMRALPQRLPVLLTGSPGVGKSDLVSQATKALSYEILISHPVVSDPTDFKGFPSKTSATTAEFLPFGDLQQMITAKKPLIVFFDDLGQAPQSVQAAVMQLILARRVNDKKVSDKVGFVAATNRRQDRAGVMSLLEPLKSRFATIIGVEPDLDDWLTWAHDHEVPAEVRAFVSLRPELLSGFAPSSDMTNSPTPRTLANAGALIKLGLSAGTRHEILAGAIGIGAATELCAFIDMADKIPSVTKLLRDPMGTPIPDRLDVLGALVGALAARITPDNSKAFFAFIGRLNGEFQMVALTMAQRLNPKLQKMPGFAAAAAQLQ